MILVPSSLPRHSLMDVSRGFAILGILWLNIFIFALPFEAMVIPGIWGEANAANIRTWDLVSNLVSGVMRGMISMLFGATALMMFQAAEKSAHRFRELDLFFRRLLWLVAFGLVHAYLLLWPHDILFVYGVLGLFLFPFRNLSTVKLLVAGAILFSGSVFFTARHSQQLEEAKGLVQEGFSEEELMQLRKGEPLIEFFEDSGLQTPQDNLDAEIIPASMFTVSDAIQQQEEDETDGEDQELADITSRIVEDMELRQQGYWENLFSMAEESFNEQTSEMMSNHVWDVGAMFFFGMALFRSGFFAGLWSARRYFFLAIAGYATGLLFAALSNPFGSSETWFSNLSLMVYDYTYDIRRLGYVLGNFSILALLLKFNILKILTNALAACGRMALTLYVGQTIVCNLLFLGFGFGLYGALEHYQIAVLAFVLTILQLLLAPIYFRFFKQGPLEKMLRWLVRLGEAKNQPT